MIVGRRQRDASARVDESKSDKTESESDSIVVQSAERVIAQWEQLARSYEKRITILESEMKEIREELHKEVIARKSLELENQRLKQRLADIEQ